MDQFIWVATRPVKVHTIFINALKLKFTYTLSTEVIVEVGEASTSSYTAVPHVTCWNHWPCTVITCVALSRAMFSHQQKKQRQTQ